MKNFFAYLLMASIVFPSHIYAAGRIQDSDVKSLTDVGGAASRLINTSKIYDATNLQQLSTSIANGQLGGTSGSGGINYILAGDAEKTITGWTRYADTPGALPVLATGGTPSSLTTFTQSTTNPLRGTKSFLFTKDATNRQGEGVAYAFTADRTDQSKMLSITADYSIDSGTYADGDLTAYIVDVTNGFAIQPVGFKIFNISSGNYGKISAT